MQNDEPMKLTLAEAIKSVNGKIAIGLNLPVIGEDKGFWMEILATLRF